MSTGRGGAYDVELINGATTIGLILDTDPNTGALVYHETPLPGSAEKIVTGQPGITDLPPEHSMKIAMEDWVGGLGAFVADDPTRGGTSTGADTAYPNMIIPGAVTTLTTVTASSTDTGTNGSFQLGDLTEWSEDGPGSLTYSTANPRTGAGHGRYTSAAADDTNTKVSWTISASGTHGKACVFTIYATSGGVANARAFVTDDDGTINGAVATLTGSYVAYKVEKVINKSSGNVVFGLQLTSDPGGSFNVDVDDATALFSHDSTFGKFCDHEGATYVAIGGVVYQWTGSAYLPRWVSSVGVTDLVSFGTYLLVARGASDEFAYANDATSRTGYTIMTANGNLTKGNFFSVMGVDTSTPPVPVVYKARNPNDLDQSVDPTTHTSWTNTADIGSTSINFTGTGVGSYGGSNQHFMGKADALWRGTTLPSQLLPRTYQGTSNFKVIHTASWGWTYITLQNGGVQAYDPYYGVFYDISPSRSGPYHELVGQATAIASDDNWLYLFLKHAAGHNHYTILKGAAGVDRVRWHVLAQIDQDTINAAHVSRADGTLRLFWAGTNSGAPTIGRLNLPTNNLPLVDTTYAYQTAVTYTTPWIIGRFPGMNKSLSGVHLEAQGVTATEYLGLEYQKWGDSNWTTIDATLDSTDFTAGIAEKFITPVLSTAFRFRLTWTQGTPTNTPAQLNRLVVFMALVPKTERYVALQTTIYERQSLRSAGVRQTPVKTVLDQLRTAASVASLTINDPVGGQWIGRIVKYDLEMKREAPTGQTLAAVKLILKEDRAS